MCVAIYNEGINLNIEWATLGVDDLDIEEATISTRSRLSFTEDLICRAWFGLKCLTTQHHITNSFFLNTFKDEAVSEEFEVHIELFSVEW